MSDLITPSKVQVLTHCDPRRAVRACMLAMSAPSDIEVICALNGSVADIEKRLGSIPIPSNLRFVAVPPQPVYPANHLRNVALSEARADWIFYVDTDFVFCRDFWPLLLSEHRALAVGSQKVCLCPVALWDPHGAYLRAPQRPDLIDIETTEFHRAPHTWSDAGKSVLFKYHKRCFRDPFIMSDRSSYEITDRMHKFRHSYRPAEPWGLLRREEAVLADEDFADGPMDKQQFVCALLDRGVRFTAVPEVFIFHLWHPEERAGWPDRARNLSIWLKRHNRTPYHYLLIGVDGVLPPKLAHCLECHVENLVGCDGPTSNLVSDDSRKEGEPDYEPTRCDKCAERTCIQAMKSGQRIVVGPPYLPRAVLGLDYRVCLFFHGPSFYRLHGPARSTPDSKVQNGDGTYLYRVVRTANLAEAAARVENVALLCDAANPSACAKGLQNLIGTRIPPEWLSEWTASGFPAETIHEHNAGRTLCPTDYRFYDYMRILAGTG